MIVLIRVVRIRRNLAGDEVHLTVAADANPVTVLCCSRVLHSHSHKVPSGSADAPGVPLLPPNVSMQGAARRPRMQFLQRLPLRPSLHIRSEER
jgi:hypothetical protein